MSASERGTVDKGESVSSSLSTSPVSTDPGVKDGGGGKLSGLSASRSFSAASTVEDEIYEDKYAHGDIFQVKWDVFSDNTIHFEADRAGEGYLCIGFTSLVDKVHTDMDTVCAFRGADDDVATAVTVDGYTSRNVERSEAPRPDAAQNIIDAEATVKDDSVSMSVTRPLYTGDERCRSLCRCNVSLGRRCIVRLVDAHAQWLFSVWILATL
jgi:hypothetical protein